MARDIKTAVFVLLCFSSCGYAMQLALKHGKVGSAPENKGSTHRERVVPKQIFAAHATFPLESGLYMESANLFERVFASNDTVFHVDVKDQSGRHGVAHASVEDNSREHHQAQIMKDTANDLELVETGDAYIAPGNMFCKGAVHHMDFHDGEDVGFKAKCVEGGNASLVRTPQTVLFASINGDGDHEIAAQQIVDVANEDMLVVLIGGVAVEKVFPVLKKSMKNFMVTKSGQDKFWWIAIFFVFVVAVVAFVALLVLVGTLAAAVVTAAKVTAYLAVMAAASAAAAAISVGAAATAVAAATAAVTAATAGVTTAAAIGAAIYHATHRRRAALPKPATNPEEATQVSAVCHELMDLDLSQLTHSNLGGLGPDTGPDQFIRYKSVATVDGKSIDLVIVSIGDYVTPKKGKNAGNGGGGSIKKIFQKSGTRMELQFSFIDASTSKPHFMNNVQFSFLDIDGFPNGDVEENILICDATDVCLTEDTNVKDNGLDADNCRWYKPKDLQAYENPTDVDQMDAGQKAHSLTVKLQKSAGFRLVSDVTNGKGNRAILFAGKGVACPGKKCTAATQEIDWAHAFDHAGWVAVPGVMTALKRTGTNTLSGVDVAFSANIDQDSCYIANWWSSFDRKGWSQCADGHYLAGLHRNGCDKLYCLEEAYCCKQALSSGYAGGCTTADWWKSFDEEGWSKCPDNQAIVGLYRNDCHELHCLEEARCCPYKTEWDA